RCDGVMRAALVLLLWCAAPSQASDGTAVPGAPRADSDDVRALIGELESPTRAAWQHPDEVVKTLKLRSGDTVCDLGSGPGYFSLRLARAVGPGGHVYAVDSDARMVQALNERIATSPHRNVTPVLGFINDPLLQLHACDVVIMVNSYH